MKKMKKMVAVASVAMVTTSGAAIAQSAEEVFNDATVGVTAIAEPLDFTIEGNRDGINNVEIGFTTFYHSYNNINADVRFSAKVNPQDTDSIFLRGEYNANSFVSETTALYGTMALQYNTDSKIKDGVVLFDPKIGVWHEITDYVGVYAEVGYTWELNKSKDDLGGLVKVGFPVRTTPNTILTPSISRSFNSDNDTTAAELNLTFLF